ncbi:50S ribosomal protein L4 [Candidatus Parcubacteria bacterium]|nr:50S ribosomal protein L4 [Candidatus Parcubacteria bacterium]
MVTAKRYNQVGELTGEVTLPAEVFGVRLNRDLVHQALRVQAKNRRQVLAHTKDRSEVRGGGRKPWRQKGTGRARHGSIRSPLWRGGGITFGPTKSRVFAKTLPKKMRQLALRQTLSAKVAAGDLVVLERFPESAKTKDFAALFAKMPAKPGRLVVVPSGAPTVRRALRNLVRTRFVGSNSLNVFDLAAASTVIVPEEVIGAVTAMYGPSLRMAKNGR